MDSCVDTSRRAVLTAAALFLGGCASAPVPVLLTLPPGADGGVGAGVAPVADAADRTVVRVRRLAIPEYMEARRVRYRSDSGTLAEWPNTYWAERIEVGMSREFLLALQAELPRSIVCDAGCAQGAPALTVIADLDRLDYVRSAKRLKASARIRVLAGAAASGRWTETTCEFDLPTALDGAAGQAQAMAAMLRSLAGVAARAARSALDPKAAGATAATGVEADDTALARR